jgi:metal-sulfur cluster biosynthetic enzyme
MPVGPQYDATLHAFFLGFVFAMIFAHAPIIFPAVLGARMAYRPLFYAHVVLLQLTLSCASSVMRCRVERRTSGRWPAQCRDAAPVSCEHRIGAAESFRIGRGERKPACRDGCRTQTVVFRPVKGAVEMTAEKQRAGSDPRVLDALRQVVDPELGHQYRGSGIGLRQRGAGRSGHVSMTMTTPACPMEELLMEMVHAAILREMPEARSVEVDLVWDPAWKPEMMSPAAKAQLGRT